MLTIFTNRVLRKMEERNLSEKDIRYVLQAGSREKASFGGEWNAIKKYRGKEIGVNFDEKDGKIIVVSAWKRKRR